jgi:hypothetical protein
MFKKKTRIHGCRVYSTGTGQGLVTGSCEQYEKPWGGIFPLWTLTLRQWIIGSRRFEATYCRHLQRLLGYFEHWRLEYYLASTDRDPFTHWRSVTSQRNHIRCNTAVIHSKFPTLRLQKIIWNLWLTDHVSFSDLPCRVELFSHDARSLSCREGQKLEVKRQCRLLS